MARPKPPDLSHLARPGSELAVRVTPGASREAVEEAPEGLRVRVTVPLAEGRANEAVRLLLARALGVAKGRLTLVAGATSREKRFRLDDQG